MIFHEIKKNIFKHTNKILKIKKKTINNDFRSLYLTFFSALLLIGLFSSLPFISSYTSKLIFDSKLIDNTSKIDFDYTVYTKEILKKFEDSFKQFEKI